MLSKAGPECDNASQTLLTETRSQNRISLRPRTEATAQEAVLGTHLRIFQTILASLADSMTENSGHNHQVILLRSLKNWAPHCEAWSQVSFNEQAEEAGDRRGSQPAGGRLGDAYLR